MPLIVGMSTLMKLCFITMLVWTDLSRVCALIQTSMVLFQVFYS